MANKVSHKNIKVRKMRKLDDGYRRCEKSASLARRNARKVKQNQYK